LGLVLVAAEAFADEGHAAPRWGDFGLRVLNIAIFIAILWHFVGKMTVNYFRGRREGIVDSMSSLRERREKAEQDLQSVETRIANLSGERDAILAESKVQAESLKAAILADAKRQAEQIVEQARLTAENEGRAVLAKVRSTIADEIVDAAGALLGSKLSAAEHERLIVNSLNKVVLR
jgi:F-type H+-transporting ATPase subunit b